MDTEDPELQKILAQKAKQLLNQGISKTKGEKFKRGEVNHLDSNNFEEFLKTFDVAVIDFWAEWCAPCFILAPIIEELAADYPNVGFGKLNSDENPDISATYGVMSLPTVLIFKHGEPVDGVIGAVPREEIEERLKRWL